MVVAVYPYNKYNWDACLCRLALERLNDVVKVVCLEMPQQHLDNMAQYEECRQKLTMLDNKALSPVRRQVEMQKAVASCNE